MQGKRIREEEEEEEDSSKKKKKKRTGATTTSSSSASVEQDADPGGTFEEDQDAEVGSRSETRDVAERERKKPKTQADADLDRAYEALKTANDTWRRAEERLKSALDRVAKRKNDVAAAIAEGRDPIRLEQLLADAKSAVAKAESEVAETKSAVAKAEAEVAEAKRVAANRIRDPPPQQATKKRVHVADPDETDPREPRSAFAAHLVRWLGAEQAWKKQSKEGGVLDFGARIWGEGTSQTWMMVRRCYPKMLNVILAHQNDSVANVVVAGSKGIGKSFFGLYLLMHYVTEHVVVAYAYGSSRILLVPEGAPAAVLKNVNNCLSEFEFARVTEPGVYWFPSEDASVFTTIMRQRGVAAIQDVGEGTPAADVNVGGTTKYIVLTSPDLEKIGRLGISSSCVTYFMPTWSWEEIETVNASEAMQHCPHDSQVCAKLRDELKELFELFGGVPRHVFSRKDPRESVRTAIKQLNLELLTTVFRTGDYKQIPRMGPGMGLLVRFEPEGVDTADKLQRGRIELASNGVLVAMQQHLLTQNEDVNFRFFNAVAGVRGLQAFRGYFLERCLHAMLTDTDVTRKVKVRPLGSPDAAWREVEWSGLKRVRFSRMDMNDLDAFAEGDYGEPTILNFPSVDSFAVMPQSVFKPGARHAALVMFQATVSEEHIVRGPDLKRVFERVVSLTDRASLPTLLVFVTTPQGVDGPQTIKNGDGVAYSRADAFVDQVAREQYALCLGGRFEQIAEAWKGADTRANIW